nr:ATP-binding protein [Chloroflexota bacterium]
LIVDGELIGVAYVNHTTEQHRPAPEDLSFAATLADQCAVAIDKTRLMERSEAAHRRLLAVVDQLPQGVVIVEGTSGQIALANRATEELLGTSLDNAPPGLGFGDADGTPFPPGEAPLERILRTGQERFSETLTISRPDGSTVKVLANHAPVTDATGRIVGAVGVIQDIAQVTAIDRAKDEFLSVVAHELRNPLTSLRGNLQLLLRRVRKEGDPARAEEADRLEAIILQSDRMAELVSRLLEVSRADLGRLDLSYGPSDAAAMVRRGVQSARGLSKEHRIVEETPATCPVVWDAVRIEQMLANLLSNAVKYTRGGEVRVTVMELPGDRVRIAVQDQGPGIPDAVKTRLFDRYYRAEADRDGASGASRPNTAEGLGLGLYISHKIVVAHGGDLTVEDAPEGGAVFVATLPRDASGDENTAVLLATTAPADHRA